MNQKILHKVFIWGFLFLYLLVALISFCHAVQFFGIGNVKWMSISLAFSFELGLALSLASILLSDKNKKQTLPWILMITLTAIQVIGNVYSVFRYISLSEEDYYQYLAKPLLFFIQEVDENTIQVIVSWIMGAILPIVALMMTDMVANNIKNVSAEKEESKALEEHNDKEERVKDEKIETPKDNSNPITVEEIKENLNPAKKEGAIDYNDVINAAEKKIEENKKEEIISDAKEVPINEPKEDSISDYVEVLAAAPKRVETIPTEEKKTGNSEKKEEKKSVISKLINNLSASSETKKVKPAVVNMPNNDNDHLGLRKANESYFRDPTKKI